MFSIRRALLLGVLILSVAMAFFLAVILGCSGGKRVYTQSILPVFLNDSTALVFLFDYTETSKPVGDFLVSGSTLKGYKVNYRTGGAIKSFMGNIERGSTPNFRPNVIGDSIFFSSEYGGPPATIINLTSGKSSAILKEPCCSRLLSGWPTGELLFRSDSGVFQLWSFNSDEAKAISPDSVFESKAGYWHDLYYGGNEIFGIQETGGKPILKRKIGNQVTEFALPILPLDLPESVDLKFWIPTNTRYVVLQPKGYSGVSFGYPIDKILLGQTDSSWVWIGQNKFNHDLSVFVDPISTGYDAPVDSTRLVFRRRDSTIVSSFDFSGFSRR